MEIIQGIHHFDTGPFNWYLLEEAGRITLVDAGFPCHYGVFAKGLREIGKSIQDVEAIILTHAHADHTGFAERLRSETNAKVYIHQDDKIAAGRILNLPWYGLLSNAWRSYTRSMLLHATWNGVFHLRSLDKLTTFTEGDILDVPGCPRVIHIPGHTAGEVAFFLPDKEVLFSGDTLVTRDLMTGRDGGPQVPHRLLNGNDKEARRSIDRLQEIGRVTMLPGHGKPWIGSMEEAVDLARKSSSH